MVGKLRALLQGLFLMQVLILTACDSDSIVNQAGSDELGFSSASTFTIEKNQSTKESLALENVQDFEDVRKGLIAEAENLVIRNEENEIIWDMSAYNFIQGDSPNTVNPDLWRQEQLNNIAGLFELADGIYQVRGFDLANMTIIEAQNSWIIVDPLTSTETAAAALAFARANLEEKPIKTIIYTHSHIDHFGGVLGVVTAEEIVSEDIQIIAPAGFMVAATSENIIVGVPLGRRAGMMYGVNLPRSARGQIGSGLGKAPAFGSFGILAPTDTVSNTGETRNIDGVEVEFQIVSGSEAPSEFTFFLPQWNIFVGAELVSRNMHNIYSLRGAEVRDAMQWSHYIGEAIQLFGGADILVNSHHWPVWGSDEVIDFLEKQRDMYRYIHDQSVRLINAGYTPTEIAEELEMPATLSEPFANHGYYGTLSHNAKAVYQHYLGWFDANPAHLNPLPASQSSKKYVALAGGADNLMLQANDSFEKGEYRWAAELLNHLVFAEPSHQAAKELLANTYDQLGYVSNAASWRNFYLSAAFELRHGEPASGVTPLDLQVILANTSLEKIFSSMAVRLNGPDAEGKELTLDFIYTDISQRYLLTVNNSVLNYKKLGLDDEQVSDTQVKVTRSLFNQLIVGDINLSDIIFSDSLDIEGSNLDLIAFFLLLDQPDSLFKIVEP